MKQFLTFWILPLVASLSCSDAIKLRSNGESPSTETADPESESQPKSGENPKNDSANNAVPATAQSFEIDPDSSHPMTRESERLEIWLRCELIRPILNDGIERCSMVTDRGEKVSVALNASSLKSILFIAAANRDNIAVDEVEPTLIPLDVDSLKMFPSALTEATLIKSIQILSPEIEQLEARAWFKVIIFLSDELSDEAFKSLSIQFCLPTADSLCASVGRVVAASDSFNSKSETSSVNSDTSKLPNFAPYFKLTASVSPKCHPLKGCAECGAAFQADICWTDAIFLLTRADAPSSFQRNELCTIVWPNVAGLGGLAQKFATASNLCFDRLTQTLGIEP